MYHSKNYVENFKKSCRDKYFETIQKRKLHNYISKNILEC